jgi:phytoene synthase
MTPDEYCQQKAAQSGSSFYYSFLFLPPERRRAITALYAFCREVDDVVDEIANADIARTKLAWWRHEIGQLFAGAPSHPVAQALKPVIARTVCRSSISRR